MKLQSQSLIVSRPCAIYGSRSMQSEQCALRRWPFGFPQAMTYRLVSTGVVDPESLRLSVRSPAGRKSRVRAQLQDQDPMIKTPDSLHLRLSMPNALNYHVPNFTPFSTHNLNPLMDEAVKGSQEWAVQHFGTIIDAQQLKKISEANIYRLPCGIYSTASLSRLEWVVEYFLLLYIWDDEVLHRQLESSRRGVAQIYLEVQLAIMSTFPDDKILRETLEKYLLHHADHESTRIRVEKVLALAGQHQDIAHEDVAKVSHEDVAKVSPICTAFLDLWTRATFAMPDEWSLRFAHTIQRDMFATFQEAQEMDLSIQPSISAYIPRRRETGFAESAMVVADYVEDVFLPNWIYYSPSMQRLLEATIDAICWHNDIWSFPKELVAGEVYNLVYLVSKEKECSYNKAAEIVNQMVVDKCIDMQLGAAELRVYSRLFELTVSESDAIERYIACCNAWISSTHEFHSSSSRFRP